jgi:hypothetical protein
MFTAGNIRRWVEGLNEYERQTWSIHAFEPHFADEADADPLLSKDEVSGADLGDGVRYFVSCCKNAGVKKRLPSVWTAGYSPVREKTTSIGKEILRKVRSIDFSPVETKEDTIQVSYSLFRPEVAQAIIKYMHEPAKENLEAVRQICEQFGEMYVDVASSWNGIIPCVPRRFLEEWQIKDPNFPSLLKAIDVAQKNVWDRIILPRVEGIYTPGRDGVDWNESKNAQSSLQKCSRYYCNWQELGEAISPRRIRDYFLPVVSSVKRLFRRLG